jgi:hypothetical protein
MIATGSGLFRWCRDSSPSPAVTGPRQADAWTHKGHASSGEVAMRPVRTITELLFAPAITIAGWSDHPTTLQAGAPASPPAPSTGASPGRDPRGMGWFLGLGLVGLAVLLTGLIWDAGLHTRNPALAHQEGLFTLANPGHLLLFAGIVAAAVGMVGATWTRLSVTTDPRRSRRARCLLLLSMAYITTLSAVAVNRAASAESLAHGHDAGHVHATGACQPTSAESGAATRLVADTRQGAARFADPQDALAAGYLPHVNAIESVKHHFNPAYVTDGRVLDPARPEGLLYAYTTRGVVLVAAVYLMNHAGEPGRAVGGCLTQWHAHDTFCSSDPADGKIDGVRRRGGRCPPGQVPWTAPPMLHTWVIDLPAGPFAGHVGASAVFDQLHATPRPSTG